jgi:yersiniabactin nonribosomal peptide synthetase
MEMRHWGDIQAVKSAEPLNIDTLRRQIATLAGRPPSDIGDHDDLVGVGLDSIGVMKIAGGLRIKGLNLKFDELIERRTLADWWELVSSRLAPPPDGDEPDNDVVNSAPFELATMQHAYWIGRAPGQALGAGCHYYFEFDGTDVAPHRLEAAVHKLVERHDMLRARFLDDGRQQISQCSPWRALMVRNLRDLQGAAVAEALAAVRDQESHRRLEVERGLGFDVQLSLLPAGATRLHVNVDMLVCDALSFRILIDELARLYADTECELPPIAYSYPRYLAQKAALRKSQGTRAKTYWQRRLDELVGAPHLPLAVLPERVDSPRVTRREHWISPAERQILSARSHGHGVTLPMALLTAYSEALAAWSSDPRFVVNIPLFDREPLHPDVMRLVGDFTNSILLEVDSSGQLSFIDRARKIQARFRSDAANSAYSGVEVLRDLARARPGTTPTAGSVVFTSAIGMGDFFGTEAPKRFGRLAWIISQTSQVWLDCQVTELNDGLLLNWDAAQPLFSNAVLDAMFQAFVKLVRWLAETEKWDHPAPDLIPGEQLLVRERVNSQYRTPSVRLLHDGFFLQASQRPELVAVAWGDHDGMTYAELAGRARRLARVLVDQGVQAGDLVSITLPKGPGQIVAILAILYAGAVYVPVAADHPYKRRARLYALAGSRVVVTDLARRSGLEWPEGIQLVTLEEGYVGGELENGVRVSPSAIAYVIFTSGSTGEPKGVMVPHSAAMNTIEDILERFEVRAEDRVLAVSSIDFDWSVADIFELLTVGGAVVLTLEEERLDAVRWVELVRRRGVTLWQSVPALFDMLLTAASDNDPGQSLRLVMLGGDWIGLDLHRRLQHRIPGCRLVGLGGITETAIHITSYEVYKLPEHWRSIPYGHPLTNVKCRVVDSRGRDCPDWTTGELWVGGRGLAAGYLNEPELTAQRFVEYNGERWYRSGDLARYWADGTLEFLGRADSQVKIRGHRIELGEIQAALEEHPGVRQAFVTTLDIPERRLAAAVVAGGEGILPDQLRSFLAERLPGYMTPAQISILGALPLTPNGKVDRAEIRRQLALEPAVARPDCDPPVGEVERILAGLWSELLGVARISRSDSFFALGGDSLVATRLVGRLRQAGLEAFELRRLFATPQLKDVAATLQLRDRAQLEPRITPDPANRYQPFHLTDIQRAYWLGRRPEFVMGGVGSYWYWEFDGEGVDLERLEAALNLVIERHDMLRAVLDDQGSQRVLPETPRLSIPIADVPDGCEKTVLAEFREMMSHRVMDPTRWPLFEVRALRYCGGRTRIGFGFDYIVVDALSIMIIFSELAALYENTAATLPKLELTFRDYVGNLSDDAAALAAAQDYWSRRLASLPAAPQLPLARNPEALRSPRFVRREARLQADEWRALTARARDQQLTNSAVLATAYAQVLSAWSGQKDLTLNFTLFDRREAHPDVNRIVGDFTSLLLIPYSHDAGAGWSEAVRRLQEQIGLNLEHRSVSALWVMRELARRTARNDVTMPVVFTSTLGVADDLVKLSLPFGEYAGGLSQTPQVWLDNQVAVHRGELLVNWDAVEELFPPDMLDSMFAAYITLLKRLAAPQADWSRPALLPLPEAQRRVRAEANCTAGRESGGTLHGEFFARAARRPERTALIWGLDERLTYGDLAEKALRLAASLRAGGMKPGDAVGVTIARGPDQVVAVLGILAAGGVYVPVGIEQPRTRAERMYAKAGVSVTLRSLSAAGNAPPPLDGPMAVPTDSAAYVIYTSGSTGEPKGVAVSHRAALNTIEDVNDRLRVDETDRVLALSALDFDLSVYDIFGLLSVGGSVLMLDEETRRDPRHWVRLARAHSVTVWNTVPALLEMLLVSAREETLSSLRLALVSGDWVPLDLRRRLRARAPSSRLVALGGATEAAIWSNWFEVDEASEHWRSVPYGRPLRNQKFRVVNEWEGDCPDWTPGELWIGGSGVALGYRGDPMSTAEKFVERQGERWYRTGDVGRYWPDGTLEFLGRNDGQIKVRGYRIELGEIESALETHGNVIRAVAAAGSGGQTLVVGAVTPAGAPFDPAELRSFLAARLPSYMIPHRIVALETVPLTSNGKVDRAAVSRLASDQQEAPTADPPNGPVEQAIARLWTDLLPGARLSRDKSFFAMGGDSLLATQFVDQARRRFGAEIGLRQLLDAPTISQIASIIADQRPDFEFGMVEEGIL